MLAQNYLMSQRYACALNKLPSVNPLQKVLSHSLALPIPHCPRYPGQPHVDIVFKNESASKTGSLKHRYAWSLMMWALIEGHVQNGSFKNILSLIFIILFNYSIKYQMHKLLSYQLNFENINLVRRTTTVMDKLYSLTYTLLKFNNFRENSSTIYEASSGNTAASLGYMCSLTGNKFIAITFILKNKNNLKIFFAYYDLYYIYNKEELLSFTIFYF
uniref:PALP domain-containing protein n=1 Tax=Heterorhabditis bacteriophora TaxID=37862 RepID=A0A1I7WAH4_HETBA